MSRLEPMDQSRDTRGIYPLEVMASLGAVFQPFI
jgi:hypothetical protein